MRLVPFEYAGHNLAVVFINPEQVVAVRAFANSTHIHCWAAERWRTELLSGQRDGR
ncbi:hypothetical protein Rleg9DRAFT_0934 [Rhizobium leguminosarum bv. trifolii WSM597]|uniref:Uncharacterized protein n=1 Tax=Rhizobium leguminosarum bv. trifolii WSM597 TaxID=754764 RepID=J0GX57_RHILT|nr:hypothetical protein Rleg9DRAFT_0934 [Rhizobium leguminosarum bv. trifolii WSM597]